MDYGTALRSEQQRIVRISGSGESEHPTHEVGRPRPVGVTAIKPCYENGQMAVVTWFEVYVGDRIAYHVNAAHIAEVEYAKPETEEQQ